jgi:hypothetical protein
MSDTTGATGPNTVKTDTVKTDTVDTETVGTHTIDSQPPLKPRAGTIVWGSILLVVGFLAIFASQVDFGEVTPAVVVWTVIGFGSALVLAAIVTAIVKAAGKDRVE